MTKMTTPIDPAAVLPDVEKIIFQLCHRFSETYPISYDECLSEGYLAFMKACGDYKPERGQKFSTWVYYWVWCKLKDLVMKRSKEPITFVQEEQDLVAMAGGAETLRSESLELVNDLSGDAQEIISLLLETPSDVRSGVTSAKQLLNRVKDHLIKQGREKNRVEKAHREIRLRFQEAWAT